MMGTKNNPGKWDCYHNAEPDEPMFTLLARDRLAGHLVSIWSKIRMGDMEAAGQIFDHMIRTHGLDYCVAPDVDKAIEAMDCAAAMFEWRKAKCFELTAELPQQTETK
jgi:hypothetical protein